MCSASNKTMIDTAFKHEYQHWTLAHMGLLSEELENVN